MSLLKKNRQAEQAQPTENPEATLFVNFNGQSAAYHATNAIGHDIMFVPGRNEIRQADWEYFQRNPHFKRDVEAGVFTVSDGVVEP